MHSFFSQYQEHLRKNYTSLTDDILLSLSPQLASPFVFKLAKKHFLTAQNIVTDLFELQKRTSTKSIPSLLNSLDVHINENNDLKIIEINTNASSYLVNTEHVLTKKLKDFSDAKEKLKMSFQKTFGDRLRKENLFLVIDENPQQQNMYFEFLMFCDFLKKEFSVECHIADPKELTINSEKQILWQNRPIAGIYNRCTDFYFANYPALAEAFRFDKTLISPNPWGYQTLADKNLLVDWSTKDLKLPALQKALLKTYRFSDFKDADELWSQRSRFFFKPPNAYGSRSVYNGKSISKTVYQRIYSADYIAQEIVPAPLVKMIYDQQEHTFKYDLRFYFFEGEIHLAVARLYQGQLTNLQTPLGGLTPLEII
ncbi:hypothetical protein K2X05_14770 [bacterium]|nr:hypothetical protein [bacterium]